MAIKSLLLLFLICASSFSVNAESNVEVLERPFEIKLSASRLVYNLSSRGALITVENPQEYPILVQSEVLSERLAKDDSFFVSPPLVRLEPNQALRLRLLDMKGDYPKDRESLRWLCVKGVPPSKDSLWNDGGSKQNKAVLVKKISLSTCIKLLVRPDAVQNIESLQHDKVSWTVQNNKLVVNNESPFYLHLNDVDVGREKLQVEGPVPPYSHIQYDVPVVSSAAVRWSAINDLGGVSPVFESIVK
ncbi:fimbria/pilus periplasmic chaperone [Aeromonas sp. R9-2]|uniref:fimbria/pilus periplasmic chaperone n=1 Tax=Aeromonas sp. R9-2 TaxID=3138479 RepID=UPI0034A43879